MQRNKRKTIEWERLEISSRKVQSSLTIVKGTNRFKGLDLIDRGPEELWKEVCDIVQEAVIKTIPKENMQKGKMVV